MQDDAQANRRKLEQAVIEAARHVRAGPSAQRKLDDLLAELDAAKLRAVP